MWNEGDPRRELRGHEVAMGRSGSEVVVLDERVIEAAARAQPGHTNINVTKSSRLHIGPKFVSVTQNVDNSEVVKGRILGLELVSPHNSKRLRCSIAVFVCWAFVVASGLTFFIFHFALAKQAKRLDLDLPLPRYLWDIAKSTTRAERLSCAAAVIVLSVCIVLIVYFTVIANKTANSVEDVSPHEWYITREMWLAPAFINQNAVTEYEPLKLVIVAHTVSAECTVFMNCAAELRNLQTYFLEHHGYDLPYNFLIGNEGRVYEGRGWTKNGAHTRGYNSCTLGLAFIGDYREGSPSYSKVTELQLQRAKMLLERGVELGHLEKNYHVLGAKDVQNSLSPGTNLYKAIQQWPSYDHENFYKGKSCEEIYSDRNQTRIAGQTAKLLSSFRNPTGNQSLDT